MNRTLNFTKRNFTEISRDPLSYIFCLAFPVVMLIVMSLVNESIPKEAGVTMFRIDNLLGGIIVFGHTFIMLFTALTVSNDRTRSFLMRLFATPMKSSDFTNGYILPMIFTAIVQMIVSIFTAVIVSLMTGTKLEPIGLLLAVFTGLPSALMFASLGLIFGTLFNEKSAPGICSIIISLGSFLGGIWFDAEATGGVLYKICRCLPFIYATNSVRAAIRTDFDTYHFWISLAVVMISAAVFMVLSSVVFKSRMKADLS